MAASTTGNFLIDFDIEYQMEPWGLSNVEHRQSTIRVAEVERGSSTRKQRRETVVQLRDVLLDSFVAKSWTTAEKWTMGRTTSSKFARHLLMPAHQNPVSNDLLSALS
jgi:hypothetical protein